MPMSLLSHRDPEMRKSKIIISQSECIAYFAT